MSLNDMYKVQQHQVQPANQQPSRFGLTPEIALEKFAAYLNKLDKGELDSSKQLDWEYYYRTYIGPTFDQSGAGIKDLIITALTKPKLRLNLIGDLWYIMDYFLQRNKDLVPIFQPDIVNAFKWCYFRILYQKLIAAFVRHQGLPADSSQLEIQQLKIDKVLKRWRAPQPSNQQRAEWEAQKAAIASNDLLINQDIPTLVIPPIFNQETTESLDTVQTELLTEFKSRLAQQQAQFDTLMAQYRNNIDSSGINPQYADQQSYLSSQSDLESWNYGDFGTDLLNALADDILGPTSSLSKKNQPQGATKRQYTDVPQSGDDYTPNTKPSHPQQQRELRFPPQPPPSYTTDTYRLLQPSVWTAITTTQFICSSCGMFFENNEHYADHISWHRKINSLKMDKKQTAAIQQRQYGQAKREGGWYYSAEDWQFYRHTQHDIPFYLLPAHIQQQKYDLQSYEKMFSQRVTDATSETGASVTAKELLERQQMALLTRVIKTYDDSSRVGIAARLQTLRAKLFGRYRAAGKELQLTDLANLDVTVIDEDDDEQTRQDELAALPYFNPSAKFDSISRSTVSRLPMQLSDEDDGTNRMGILGGSNSGSQNNNAHGKRMVRCVVCSDQLTMSYNEDQDTWVYTNALVLSYKTLVAQCKRFLLNIKQFHYEHKQGENLVMEELNRGGFIDREKQLKLHKVTFTPEEEEVIEKTLQPLLKRYTTEHYANRLVHFSPCFNDILKQTLQYSTSE